MSRETPYEEGYRAAKDMQPIYANPYCERSSLIADFHQWFAGWCWGMQTAQRADKIQSYGVGRRKPW